MTVRTSVSFTDQNHAFAADLVGRGTFNSVSAVVAAGLQALREREEERMLALDAVAREIRLRALAPREDFIDFDGEAVLRRLRERGE